MIRRRAQATVRWMIALAVLLAAGLGVYFAYLSLRPVVTVTEVVQGPAVQAFYATGTLQPLREYPIRSNTEGLIEAADPAKPYIDKGDHVAKGQPLAVVIDTQLRYLADKAAAMAEERRKRFDEKTSPVLQEFDAKISATSELLDIAKREQARITRLMEGGGASQSDFDRALDRVKTLWSELESEKSQKESMRLQLRRELDEAESALKIANWNLDQQVLRSPIDGVVLDRPVSLGTRLKVNDHAMLIADVRPENMVMRAQVDEEDVTKVRLGQVVRMVLYSFAGEPFDGKVTRIYDKADPERRTFEVEVSLSRTDRRFAAGMTGELAFEVQKREQTLVVPSQAVQEGKLYLVRNGRVKVIDADVGLKGVERTEILKGVQPGDRIVISPATSLHDGQTVRTQYVEPLPAAEQNRPKAKEGGKFGF